MIDAIRGLINIYHKDRKMTKYVIMKGRTVDNEAIFFIGTKPTKMTISGIRYITIKEDTFTYYISRVYKWIDNEEDLEDWKTLIGDRKQVCLRKRFFGMWYER